MKTTKPHKNYNNKILLCPSSGKVGFASESAVSKKIGKYNDIVRYYLCPDPKCQRWHLTSDSITETLGRNVVDCSEENRLLKLQNLELSAEIKILKKVAKKDFTPTLQKRKHQITFLSEFIYEQLGFTRQQQRELLKIIAKIE